MYMLALTTDVTNMTTLIDNLKVVVTAFVGWVAELASAIIANPVLLMGFGIAVGAIILKLIFSMIK